MISSLKFTKKGILNEFPFVRKFDEKLFNSVSERLGLDLDSVDSANVADAGRNAHLANDGSRRDATFDEDEPRSLNSNMVGIEAMNLDANGNSTAEIQLCSVEARYEMDDYDDDDQDMDEVAIEKEIDAEEMEELRIEPNDSIIVASKFEDDVSQLEIYVYEQDNLYVHHDILLSQMALATEVIDYNGQYCAVGTFNPIIEVFNVLRFN